jgi:hypothetical protein
MSSSSSSEQITNPSSNSSSSPIHKSNSNIIKIDLRCEICSSRFDATTKVPKVLSCGHTICSFCLAKITQKNITRCPFDRKVFDSDPAFISTNFYILSLLDQAKNSTTQFSLNLDFTDENKLTLIPKPVVNHPGWKNTLDAFIHENILYSVETNGFIYCTNLSNGEWWFMYNNQFFGNFFFITNDKRIFLIDQSGALYQIFNRNFYVQIGRKNAWKNTQHVTIFNNKMYTIESPNKFYETNLTTGKWKEIVIKKAENESLTEIEQRLFKGITMLISNSYSIIFTNKYGEVFQFTEQSGETRLIKTLFPRDIECYSSNSTYVYFITKSNPKIIYRAFIDNVNNDNKANNVNQSMFMKKEIYLDLSMSANNLYPIKIVVNDTQLVIIDKNGNINLFELTIQNNQLINPNNNIINKTNSYKIYQCLFMLRNCHLINTCLLNEGDLLLLDPIRLSLNKLNIIAGTELIVLHSNKFLFNIKNIFTANSKIYFIEVTGNLYYFSEIDKKLTQIGNNGICKFISDYVVYKNYLLTVENDVLYKTSLTDGNFVDVKADFFSNYEYLLSDNINIVVVNRDDEVIVYDFDSSNKNEECLREKKRFVVNEISKVDAIILFKRNVVFYRKNSKTIEGIDIDSNIQEDNKEVEPIIFVKDFPDINIFISNNEMLACIIRNGVIYKLFC